MATKKKPIAKKVVKKSTPLKKVKKDLPLDFSLIFSNKGIKDTLDLNLTMQGNLLAMGVALGQLITKDKKLQYVFKVAIEQYMRVIDNTKPIAKLQKVKKSRIK